MFNLTFLVIGLFFLSGCGGVDNILYDCNGEGTIKYSYGEYKGECEKDKRDGYGIMVYNDGGKYDGNWKDDEKSGFGIMEYPSGDRYEGYWRADKKDGNGTYYYNSGTVYNGSWKSDEKSGYGVEAYYWGDKYEGSWKFSKKDGKGVYSSQYGIYEGSWVDNNLTEIFTQDSYEEAYLYFNKLRRDAGLIELEINSILEDATKSHSRYIQLHSRELEGLSYHDEIEGTEGFTGKTAGDRVVYQGYFYRLVGEGISQRETAKISINGLMTAIYHRFEILSLSRDEFGIGFTKDSSIVNRNFVHNMGNSNLNDLCQRDSYSSGDYKYKLCKDLNHRIEDRLYNDAINSIKEQNPEYVLWPPKDSKDNLYRFEDETPDPIPDYNKTGNPVSVQFNDYFYPNKIVMESFRLFKDGDEINNIRVLTKDTDPNGRFSEYEFALFPLDILERNQEYRAEFKYIYNGEEKVITWSFKTKQ